MSAADTNFSDADSAAIDNRTCTRCKHPRSWHYRAELSCKHPCKCIKYLRLEAVPAPTVPTLGTPER